MTFDEQFVPLRLPYTVIKTVSKYERRKTKTHKNMKISIPLFLAMIASHGASANNVSIYVPSG